MRMPEFDNGTTNNDVINQIVDYIAKQEGFRSNVYWDSVGRKRTSGYGFTAPQHQHKWTEKDARNVLRTMVQHYDRMLTDKLGDAYTKADVNRKIGYADLMHQAGIHWDKAMPKFYAAALAGDEAAMQREMNWGVGQTDSRNNARRSLFGYTSNTGVLRRQSDPSVRRVVFKNPNLPLVARQDNTEVQRPNLDIVQPTNVGDLKTTLQNKVDATNSMLNVYNMAEWSPNNTLPEVSAYGIDKRNRISLPNLRSMMDKQFNPVTQLNQQFEDYVSDMMNPMKYQIKMPNIFENM